MATKTFQMPAAGTAEFDELMARWETRVVSFGQCGMLKTKIRNAAEFGFDSLEPKLQARIAHISVRDENGRWTNLRNDNPKLGMTMAEAARIAIALDAIVENGAAPVTVTKQAPKAATVPESHFSDKDNSKIDALMELADLSRSDAISQLVAKGKIAIASKSETIVSPPVGIYETVEGFRFEVYLVNVKGGGQAKRSRIL